MLPAPLRIALQLLTRFPVRAVDNDYQSAAQRSMLWYPAVGLIIGLLLFMFAQLTTSLPTNLQAAFLLLLLFGYLI